MMPVKFVIVKINEIHYSTKYSFSQIWFVAAFKQYIHDDVYVFFFIEFHRVACDG